MPLTHMLTLYKHRLLVTLVGLGLLTSGCGFRYDCPDAGDQWCQAASIVWLVSYKRSYSDMPDVTWMHSDDLTCANGEGFPDASRGGACVSGLYYDTGNWAKIARPANYQAHQSAIAHEFCHALMRHTTGDSDGLHKSLCFAVGGDTDRANVYLESIGY